MSELRQEAKALLKLINNGSAWQLEGSVGRRCNEFIEADLIVPDETKKGFVFNASKKKRGPDFLDHVAFSTLSLKVFIHFG